MSNALKKVNLHTTAQTERSRADEVKNNAGGFVFQVSDKARLERFLILGVDGGTYYVSENDLTKQNVDFITKMISKDTRLVVDTIVDVSGNGRAPKNSPALFALALTLTHCAPADKAYVRAAVNRVARTGTHLFEFAQYVENLGGWGRAKRQAIAGWYESKDANQLAYQTVKYRQRNGWTHRDLLRLSHAKPDSGVANFILGKQGSEIRPEILDAFTSMQSAGSVKEVLTVLDSNKNLPWETIPTQFLRDADIWKKLFYNGQLNGQALVRNVTRLSRIGAFDDMVFTADFAMRLADEEMIRKTRLHPINLLNALVVYSEGQINRSDSWYAIRRNKDWTSEPKIVDALNAAFHTSFKTIEPANKRTLIAQDISGSMAANANGLDLSCAVVGAAIGMTIARTEPYYKHMGFATQFRDLNITPGMDINTIVRKVSNQTFGGTDCSLPMLWALEHGIEVDTFVVVTDNETWAGRMKPYQALKKYRKEMGIDARLAVLGLATTEFTIADPQDRGMMDFVGFDSAAPKVLADFSAGRI